MSVTEDEPLVHTLETSDHVALPKTYWEHRVSFCYDEYNAVADAYEYIDMTEGTKFVSQLNTCKTHAYFYRHAETGDVKVISSCCRLRWCPFCADGRKFRIQEEVKRWLPSVGRPKFLTLTLKHTESPLEHQIKHLYESFQKLRKSVYFRKHVAGGLWFFQVKKSETDGLWHPHLHCLIDSVFMPREYLSDLWHKITKTSMVVDIRQVKDEDSVIDYVARYAAKPAVMERMPGDVRVELIQALHGRRLVGTWGNAKDLSFRTVKQEDSAQWQRLAAYDHVTSRYRSDDNARSIFNAWKNNQPLPEPLSLIGMADLTDDHFIKKRVRSKDCYGQCTFSFFHNITVA